jgi:hypothetical protein
LFQTLYRLTSQESGNPASNAIQRQQVSKKLCALSMVALVQCWMMTWAEALRLV